MIEAAWAVCASHASQTGAGGSQFKQWFQTAGIRLSALELINHSYFKGGNNGRSNS
jgi:hypothetical protein